MVTKGHIPRAWKKIFLEKKFCDCSRYNQMPSTDQRTEMGPNVCTYFWVAIYKYNCWVVGGGVRDDQKDGDFLRGYGRYIKNHQCFSSHLSRCRHIFKHMRVLPRFAVLLAIKLGEGKALMAWSLIKNFFCGFPNWIFAAQSPARNHLATKQVTTL